MDTDNSDGIHRTHAEERGERPGRRPIGIAICLCLLFLLNGCAPKTLQHQHAVRTDEDHPAGGTDGRKYSLTVASFIDQRKIDDTLLIGRVIESDGTPIPILPKYVKPTDAVAAALRELLFSRIHRRPG